MSTLLFPGRVGLLLPVTSASSCAMLRQPLPLPPLVIAIDGPAGAGKSTVARAVASRLGILYLDTGAMYRAATWGLLDQRIRLDDPTAITAWVTARRIGFDAAGRVTLDDQVVADRIRTMEVTSTVHHVADLPECRRHLVAAQQAIVAGREAVIEGRDATTVIAPDAALKIYLDASPEERARRRLADWRSETTAPTLAEVAAAIRDRDERDMTRAVGTLVRAEDAVHLVTDGLHPAEVEARIIALAVRLRPLLLDPVVAPMLMVGRSRQPGYVRVGEVCAGQGWQLGLTNPGPDRLPASTSELARNHGGRQAGVLCQGRAVIVLAGQGAGPGPLLALPVLPQTWYAIEPGCWHAVVQTTGTIMAWAEAQGIREDRARLDEPGLRALRTYLAVYLGLDSLGLTT